MAAPRVTDEIDAQIVALAAAGDVAGAARLLERTYRAFVREYVRKRVPAGAIDDVCQNLWAVVAAKVPADLHSPRGYLVGIARHKIGHALDERSLHELESSIAARPMWRSITTSAPGKLARAQQIEELRAALAALSADERELLQLSFHDDLRPAEIAEALGKGDDPKTVSTRIIRAVNKLRDYVKQP